LKANRKIGYRLQELYSIFIGNAAGTGGAADYRMEIISQNGLFPADDTTRHLYPIYPPIKKSGVSISHPFLLISSPVLARLPCASASVLAGDSCHESLCGPFVGPVDPVHPPPSAHLANRQRPSLLRRRRRRNSSVYGWESRFRPRAPAINILSWSGR
jgi:hypothetical protein